MVIGGSLTVWGVVRVVAWVHDLPNRITIDGDALSEALGEAATEFYRDALTNGDSATQAEVLREFSNFVTHDAALRDWIRKEFSGDLKQLRSSSDQDVATLATELLDQLDVQQDVNTVPSTGHYGIAGNQAFLCTHQKPT